MPEVGVIDLSNLDFSKNQKTAIERHIDELGEPIWKKSLDLAGNEISIINYNPDFQLTDEYTQDLLDMAARMQEINPEILKKCKKIIFDPTQPASRYNDEEKHPFNGTQIPDGVLLYKNGQRRDILHRTGVANNFQGTLAHETFHLENKEVDNLWKKEFDWKYCAEATDMWEKIDSGRTSFRNRQTGVVSENGMFTSRPEECVTDYARQSWDDDYADSGVVALFDQSKLLARSPKKLEVIQRKALPKQAA